MLHTTPPMLRRLRPQFREVFSSETYRERVPDGIQKYAEDTDRPIALAPLYAVMEAGKQRFGSYARPRRFESDRWYAPRIHAALRLYRREAADIGIWHYLSVSVFREYVIWRWGDRQHTVTEERVLGSDRRNALAHLWWAAEISRNGPDYAPLEQACAMQEALVTLTEILASNNRPAAQAFIRFVSNGTTGVRSAEEIKAIRRTLNHSLSTYTLDAAAPDLGPDPQAIERWVHAAPDMAELTGDGSVTGPQELKVSEEAVQEVLKQLESLARQMAHMTRSKPGDAA